MSYRPAAALVATIASLATAHLVLPAPESGTTLFDPRIAGQSKTEVASARAAPVRSTSPVSEEARAPVPILLARHASNASPTAAAWGTNPQDNNVAASDDLADEKAARAAIEADGYKGVRALSHGADGVWKARALRGQADVMVRVDPGGNVSAN